jgi:hypothetical protein
LDRLAEVARSQVEPDQVPGLSCLARRVLTCASRRWELLHLLGKGAKPADIPVPIPVLRAVREAVDGRRSTGLVLRTWNRPADGPGRHQPGPDEQPGTGPDLGQR